MRAHYEVAARAGNPAALKALQGPACPESLAYLWDWFLVLHGARGYGMNGPERIGLTDIDAANRLLGWRLDRQEVEALTLLDLVWLYPAAEADADG